MEVNGVWVGWGLGDWSHNPDGTDRDSTVRKAKKYMRGMFRSYAGGLTDTNKFDQQMQNAVITMQDKLVAKPMTAVHLFPGNYIHGILDLPTQQAMGFKKLAPPVLPIIATVEGHMSDMFFGPCASNAETLQNQGFCHWKPAWYDCTLMPFNNKSGVDALVAIFIRNEIEGPQRPDGSFIMWPFPPGTPWGIIGFSQGGMVVSEFMEQEVLNPRGRCHFRLKDFKRGLGIGNPRREFGKMCPWNDNPPPADTGGIMDHLFVTTGTVIQDRWQENANDKDMFAVNTRDKTGQDKTAIAKVITEGSFFGGQATIFARVLALMGNPTGEALAAIMALISAIMFLASNPNPHYSTVAEPGDIEWMRGVKNG